MEKAVAGFGCGLAWLGLMTGFVIGSNWLWLAAIGIALSGLGLMFWED